MALSPDQNTVHPGPATGPVLAELSRRVVHILREGSGRGPTKCRSYWAGEDIILVVLGDLYTSTERMLVREGREDAVLMQRHALQEVLKKQMIAAVEELTQRKVVAFMSANHSEPDVSAELFILQSVGDPRAVDGSTPPPA
jgi:uncharacterized protein YbcI